MLIAKIQDGAVIEVADYRVLFPNTSFPPTGIDEEFLQANSSTKVTTWKPHNPATEKLVPTSAYLEDNQVFTVEVQPLTEEELQAKLNSAWASVRSIRNKKLTESDWTQVDDAPLTNLEKASWAAYRQALRDITTQASPDSIEWPKAPNEVTNES